MFVICYDKCLLIPSKLLQIAPADLEAVLVSHPEIVDAAVVA